MRRYRGDSERYRGDMTSPSIPERLVGLLESLPASERQEITAWLIGAAYRRMPALTRLEARPDPASPEPIGLPLAQSVQLSGSHPATENSQLVTFRLPTDRHAELRTWCAAHGFTMAAVVRGLIERFLDEQQQSETSHPDE